MESQFGLSTDQKWVSIAPCFFNFLKISFNPGYNAAPWNTFERRLTSKQGDRYLVNDEFPLIFFHFSNFDHDDPQYLNKRASSERGVEYELLNELGVEYSRRLKHFEDAYVRAPYTYDYMSDGSYISPTLRRAYASVRLRLPRDTDPFDSTGCVGAFARKNRLVRKVEKVKYRYPGLRDARNNSKTLALIYWAMRILLHILGPNRFYDLSKLMVFLSVYRKDHKYWRL